MLREKALLKGSMLVPRELSPYDIMVLTLVQEHGGFYNAHTHLDRADTVLADYLGHINTTPIESGVLPLKAKQNLTGDLHRGKAYTEADLKERMAAVLERQIKYGTTGLATCIDVTPDIKDDGMLAFKIAKELQKQFADRIAIKIAPNPIFGFKKDSGRWEVFKAAAQEADYLSALPEKDDFSDPHTRDGKVGYRSHLRMVLDLACELKKEVHLHLDQANNSKEEGTKTLIEGLKWLDQPMIDGQASPTVWVVHMISPSAYSEERFKEIIDGLLEHNIGVIVCPSAAVSMRQLRAIMAPTHNSIARVLELLKARVPILMGTDNICDVYVAQDSGDMLAELINLGHAIRFSTPHVLAKIAAGVKLNEVDLSVIGEALYQDRKVFLDIDPNWKSAVD